MPTKPVLPRGEPRCLGRDCDSRKDCERYTRALYEARTPNTWKGDALVSSMRDADGHCRRKR